MKQTKSKKSRAAEPPVLTAEEFDQAVDAGKDMGDYLDPASVTKFVNVEFPLWMVKELDAEAARLGIARQALIKTMIDAQLRLARTQRERTA